MFRNTLMLGCLLIAGWAHAYEMEDVKRMEFQIRDPQTREIYFEGHETSQEVGLQNRRQTFYYDAGKKEVYFEDASFDKESLRIQECTTINRQSGEETIVKTEGDKARVRFRPSREKEAREEILPWGDRGFHTKVISLLILRNWEKIVGGEPYKFDLMLPFRFESLGFQLVSNKRVKGENGEERESFLLQPQNFIIRAFVPRMEFQFSVGPKPRLSLYKGPSPLPIKGTTNKMMEMQFNYPTS